jgi:hypothetical protein
LLEEYIKVVDIKCKEVPAHSTSTMRGCSSTSSTKQKCNAKKFGNLQRFP